MVQQMEKLERNTHSNDPDEDRVYYMWDWGDGTFSNWLGLYDSGEICETSHSWEEEGNYIIRVKARDTYLGESDWAELSVSMPRNRATQRPLLKLLQNYPIVFQLLQRFLCL